ncbi:MAG: hypothetical protein MR286_05050, partial [Clostridiales bacterium]|nr:hypothetical protein [Clostridiales bacterium]
MMRYGAQEVDEKNLIPEGSAVEFCRKMWDNHLRLYATYVNANENLQGVPIDSLHSNQTPCSAEKEVFELQGGKYITVLSNGKKLVLNANTILYVLMIERTAE